MPEFKASNNKKYEVEAIQDSVIAVYAKKADGYITGLYYLVAWKSYPKEENIWKPFLSIMQPRKMISTLHKDCSEKPTAILAPLDSALPMAKSTIQLPAKRKQGRLMKK